MYTKLSLMEQLERAGIDRQGTVLMHSSMKSIGQVEGGADTVLDALSAYMQEGLLVLPTHTWSYIKADNPRFYVESSPSCVGILPELFRKRPGVVRSWHPTHSIAALGCDAAAFAAGDERFDTPCHRESAWGKLLDRRATILLVGVDLRRNTFIHGIEEWMDIPGRLTDGHQPLVTVLPDGTEIPVPSRRHHGLRWSEHFRKVEKALVKLGAIRKARLGDADMWVCDTVRMTEVLSDMLRRNPDLFSDNEPLPEQRVILIGHGNISKSYLRAFAKLPQASIVGAVGRSADKVKAFAEEHGLAFYGTELEQVAREAQATAAVICTPNAAHYEGVMKASRLGLHCICEKPLHIALDKQEEMIESCKRHGVKLAVSYMRRFIPHIQFIKSLVDSGALGRIAVVDVILKNYRDAAYYDSWHGTFEHDGGGPFMQQGSHIIDMAIWLGGGYEEVTDARMFRVMHEIETEDHGYAVVRYSNGAVGMIEASTVCCGVKKQMIEISGTLGSIIASYDEIVTFDVPGVELPQFPRDESVNDTCFERLAADFVEAIERDRAPAIDGESAKTATELIRAIYAKAGPVVKTY